MTLVNSVELRHALFHSGAPGAFWLAVHGKPILFWKGISGLKFPCFLFYAC